MERVKKAKRGKDRNMKASWDKGKIFIYKNKQGEHYYSFTSSQQDKLITRMHSVDEAFVTVSKLNTGLIDDNTL